MAGDDDLEVHQRLGFLLKHAFLRMEELNDQALAPLDLTARELTLLLALAELDGASQQEAADALGIDRTTMVTFVDLLETKGLVVRRPDPSDRRRNVVQVTDDGRRVLPRARRASDEAEAELLAPLGEAERRRLRDALAAISGRRRR